MLPAGMATFGTYVKVFPFMSAQDRATVSPMIFCAQQTLLQFLCSSQGPTP